MHTIQMKRNKQFAEIYLHLNTIELTFLCQIHQIHNNKVNIMTRTNLIIYS